MEVTIKHSASEMKKGLVETIMKKSPVPIDDVSKIMVYTEEHPDTPLTLKELEIVVSVSPKG